MSFESVGRDKTLRDYLGVLRRRAGIIVAAVVVAPTIAVGLSLLQKPVYSASAQVLINPQNLSYALNGIPNDAASQSDLNIKTATELARGSDLARQVLRAAGLPATDTQSFLDHSSATQTPNTYILELSVRNRHPGVARLLATVYAREFTKYKQQLDTQSLQTALRGVERQLAADRAGSPATTDAARQNRDKLETMIALQAANTTPVRLAERAVQVQPKPIQSALFGLAAGMIVGLVLAFVVEALDTRLRTGAEISQRLGMPLLGRIPKPRRKVVRSKRLVTLVTPYAPEAEAFRVLRANLEFALLKHKARTIMVTSSVAGEGKSTTIANLAVALAHNDMRVALIDGDLRQPSLDTLFDLNSKLGLTEVVRDSLSVEDALNEIAPVTGILHVLTAGSTPPAPGEVLGSRQFVDEILGPLALSHDLVLIDTPPMLEVGDAASLSLLVDAVIVVARSGVVRSDMLGELRDVLGRSPTHQLGLVLTDAEFAQKGYPLYRGSPRRVPAKA